MRSLYAFNVAAYYELDAQLLEQYRALYVLSSASAPPHSVEPVDSDKWIGLTVDAVFFHGTFAGFSSALLYEFVRRGIQLSLVSAIFLVLVLPIMLTLPNILYKANLDTSAGQRLLQEEWLTIANKQKIFADNISNPLIPKEKKRSFFNRSVRETFYLAGTVFYLGCTFIAFWLTTPLGWAIIGIITLIVALGYLFYHDRSVKRNALSKRDIFFANQKIKQAEYTKLGRPEMVEQSTGNLLENDPNISLRQLYDQLPGSTENTFPISSKWLNIVLHSFFIEGTFSVFSSVILLGFLKYGLLVGMVGLTVMTLMIPIAATLPYFIFKVMSDMSKEERLMRMEMLLLKSEMVGLEKIAGEKNIAIEGIYFNNTPLVAHYFSSSTVFESFFFVGAIFSLGFSVLVAFSLCVPVGWIVIALAAITAGLVYGYYHHQYITGFHNLQRDIINKKSYILELKKALFTKLPDEPGMFPVPTLK